MSGVLFQVSFYFAKKKSIVIIDISYFCMCSKCLCMIASTQFAMFYYITTNKSIVSKQYA